MAMTFSKILFLCLCLFNYFKILTICPHGYPSQVELEVRSLNLKMNYYCYILSDYQKWLLREKDLLNELECEYAGFEQYIGAAPNEGKYLAASLRLLRWINILNRKLFRTNSSLDSGYKQIVYEISLRDLDNKLDWLHAQEKYICGDNVRDEQLLNQNIANLIEKTQNVQSLFEDVINEANLLKKNMCELDEETQIRLNELKSICCFWY